MRGAARRWPLTVALLLLCWALIGLGHYYVVPRARLPLLIALADPAVHGLVAVVLVLPFYRAGVVGWPLALLLVAPAVLIDVDHAVAAGSLGIKQMLSLPVRPRSHSLLFSLGAGGLLALLLRRYCPRPATGLLAYLLVLALASHVLRDAIDSHNTPWAFPLASPPWPAAGFFGLFSGLSLLHVPYAARYARRVTGASSRESR